MEVLYAFMRVTDDLADEPGELTRSATISKTGGPRWFVAWQATIRMRCTRPCMKS